MKAAHLKMFVSLAGLALTAPFFMLAVVVGTNAARLSQGVANGWWFVALALGAAVVSTINEIGRGKVQIGSSDMVDARDSADPRVASGINLGY
jgi:hypothetical protein